MRSHNGRFSVLFFMFQGQFNGWTRNSNLIAVPMITEGENVVEKTDEIPKLVLPQDRYCKSEKSPEKPDVVSSKFDRYDNSDQSESESEEESRKSDTEKSELTRSNSLEALMAELENEIQGKTSDKPKSKPKKKRKVTEEKLTVKENLKPETFSRQRKWQKLRRHNPPTYPPPVIHPIAPPPEILPPVLPFAPPTFPPFMGFDGVYASPMVYKPPPPLHVAPPIAPLTINTEFSPPTMAPLSPRSAAFVMENRAIIEKRKRRSYSRSPTPVRFRKRSLSPPRRSLSPSPIRKVVSPRSSPKKPAVHERLGSKSKTEETKKEDPVLEARRKKFERNEITMKEGVIRLKKPENEEIKKEETVVENEEIDEDALLECDDSIVLDHTIDELFSDEESDSDNEGRFKTKQETTNQKVPVLPFTKLINGTKSEVKTDLKLEEKKGERRKGFRSRTPLKSKSEKVKIGNERKIEIKIRNPAKYEKSDEEKVVRKIDIATVETPEENNETNINEGNLDFRFFFLLFLTY